MDGGFRAPDVGRAADVVCELPLPSTMREARRRGGYARDNAQRIMQEMLYGDRPHRPPGRTEGTEEGGNEAPRAACLLLRERCSPSKLWNDSRVLDACCHGKGHLVKVDICISCNFHRTARGGSICVDRPGRGPRLP